MFVSEGTLFVRVTFDASGISAGRQTRLFQFKATVRVVTIAATHRAFQNLVMERHVELRLHFVVAARAELRIIRLEHASCREARLLTVNARHVIIRTGQVSTRRSSVRRVTIGAADIIAPVLATLEVVPLLFAGVTS